MKLWFCFLRHKNSCSVSIWVPTPMHLLTVKTAIFYNLWMRNYKYNEYFSVYKIRGTRPVIASAPAMLLRSIEERGYIGWCITSVKTEQHSSEKDGLYHCIRVWLDASKHAVLSTVRKLAICDYTERVKRQNKGLHASGLAPLSDSDINTFAGHEAKMESRRP